MKLIKCLDKGYVSLIKYMGDDLDPINSAKVSFNKESTEFGDKEARLLNFLNREEHNSVFRHSALTFEVYAPLFVCRQIWKYTVAVSHTYDQLGWNESSRRYITETPEFYIPSESEWRKAPENKKQGSSKPLPYYITLNDIPKDSNPEYGNYWTAELMKTVDEGVRKYEAAMAADIAPEIARLFLPAYGLMVRWRMTMSLGALMHFLQQRLAHDTQKETTEYAKAIYELTKPIFPRCLELINENG